MNGVPRRMHGILRGLDRVPASAQHEGRFGRLFRTLPAACFNKDDLQALAVAMVAEAEETQTPENQSDTEENSGISAGYTYLGQFIDHDLTFDPVSSLTKQNDPDALVDFRTPRFDLDCVYGRGPDDQPYLYEDDSLRFLLGKVLTGNPNDTQTRDLPRNNPISGGPKRALIGDPRNDENVIVSQLQGIFLRFHNRMVDFLGAGADFAKVQRMVRWHYQWVVLNDFLKTIIGPETLHDILPHLANKTSVLKDKPDLRFYIWKNEPFIPVEFSVAAYRFGHSMIRPIYRLNTTLKGAGTEQDDGRLSIFPNLTGFGEFPSEWAIEWNLFFKLDPNSKPTGPTRVQLAYKIDTSLVAPLGNLPKPIGGDVPSLAFRNLFRSLTMGLPSGQAVARKMGLPVIADELLLVGKAAQDDSPTNKPLVELSPNFRDNAPLWFYILAEAQQAYTKVKPPDDTTPIHLGPVGGRIVGEVFAGLLLGDRHSYLRQDPCWKPFPEFCQKDGTFGITELIGQAIKQ